MKKADLLKVADYLLEAHKNLLSAGVICKDNKATGPAVAKLVELDRELWILFNAVDEQAQK